MAHAWKACWVKALGGFNTAISGSNLRQYEPNRMGKPQNLNQKQVSVSAELPRYRLGLTVGVKMNLVKSGISILSSLGLVLVLIPAAHAVFEDPWDYETPKGSVNVGIKEQNPVQISDLGVHIGKDSRLCDDGVGEGYCDLNDPKVNFQARSILELCPTTSSTNCVVGVSFRLPDGTVDEAKFIGYAGGPLFPGNPALNLRRGSQISLWQSSKAIHGGGQSTYMLNAMEYQGFDRSSRKFQSYSLSASVIPYNLIEGSKFRSQQLIEEKKFNADHIWYHPVGGDAGCVWTSDGQCGQRQEFDQNIDISIELRISNQIAGWFSGRLKNPQIEVKKFDSRTNSVKLSAKPVQVARVMKILRPGETSDKLFTALGRHGGATVEQVFYGGNNFLPPNSSKAGDSFTYIEEIRKLANDTSAGVNTYWSVSSLAGKDQNNACLRSDSKLIGVVTTNASVYDGGIPKFRSGSLEYTVSSFHYLPDGVTLNLGTYDLLVRSEVAKCLYGFGNIPLSAKVSVVNDKGSKAIATSLVSEKNGWLKLEVKGFTFSTKTIKVRISPKK